MERVGHGLHLRQLSHCCNATLSGVALEAVVASATLDKLQVESGVFVLLAVENADVGGAQPAWLHAPTAELDVPPPALNTIYVSPLLLCNLGLGGTAARIAIRISVLRPTKWITLPPPAEMALVALVRRPHEALAPRIGSRGAARVAVALRRHFQRPRVLQQGNLFLVNLRAQPRGPCARFAAAFALQCKSGCADRTFGDDAQDVVEHGDEADESDDAATAIEQAHAALGIERIAVFSVHTLQRGTVSTGLCVMRGATAVLQSADMGYAPPALLKHYLSWGRAPAACAQSSSSVVAVLHQAVRLGVHPTAPAFGLSPWSVLLHGPALRGKRTMVSAIADELGVHFMVRSAATLSLGRGPVYAARWLTALVAEARQYAPCVLLLRRLELLGVSNDHGRHGGMAAGRVASLGENAGEVAWGELMRLALAPVAGSAGDASQAISRLASSGPGTEHAAAGHPEGVVVVGSARSLEAVPASVCAQFRAVVAMPRLSSLRRVAALHSSLTAAGAAEEVHEAVPQLIEQHAALGLASWRIACSCAAAAAAAALGHAKRTKPMVACSVPPALRVGTKSYRNRAPSATANCGDHAVATHGHCAECDSIFVLAELRAAASRIATLESAVIGSPCVPEVQWADVGGQEAAQHAILETIELPLRSLHLIATELRTRSGVLLYGPPGTGKTLLAKAIATEYHLAFLAVKGPELISPFVGESERQLRDVFGRARDAAPCVIFFDEVDALAPARGEMGDAGGVMDRVVSQLMAEIDDMHSLSSVHASGSDGDSSDGGGGGLLFVLGATNRPDLLDPSLLRPGRFDRLVRVSSPDSREQRVAVLRALTRKFCVDASVDLEVVAATLPVSLHLSGADLYALCAAALTRAIHECADERGTPASGISAATFCPNSQPVHDDELEEPAESPTVVVRKRHFENGRVDLFGAFDLRIRD